MGSKGKGQPGEFRGGPLPADGLRPLHSDDGGGAKLAANFR